MACTKWTVTSRWFDGSWQSTVDEVDGSMEEAWRFASGCATSLDQRFGDDHHWNVLVRDDQGSGLVELFHGRLI